MTHAPEIAPNALESSALETAVETLRALHASIPTDEEAARIVSSRADVCSRYAPMFAPAAVDSISESDFKSFLLFENNQHWPLHRQGNAICKDMAKLRTALMVLVDESVPIEERLNRLRGPDADLAVPGMGTGILTAILLVRDPDRYGVVNTTSRAGLRRFGLLPKLSTKEGFGSNYAKLNAIFQVLASRVGTDLWTLDTLWWLAAKHADADTATSSDSAQTNPTAGTIVAHATEADPEHIAAAGSKAERYLPSDDQMRKAALAALCECICEAAGLSERCWALTLANSGVNLNVGKLQSLKFVEDAARITVVRELLSDEALRTIETHGEWDFEFKVAPGCQAFEIPHEQFAAAFDAVRSAAFAAIREGARVKQTPYFASHSTPLVAWLEQATGRVLPDPEYQTGYWKVAPGENGRLWNEWISGGFMSIGWGRLGDITGIDREEFDRRAETLIADNDPGYRKHGLRQAWRFRDIEIGDLVVANKGKTRVLGIGRVTGPYQYVEGEQYPHRHTVDWFDTNSRQVNQPGWARSLIELDRKTYNRIHASTAIDAGHDDDGEPDAARGLSARSFELLDGLTAEPTRDYYNHHRDEIQRHVEKPLQSLLLAAAEALPAEAREILETEKRLFSRIVKNDYGRGGAWPYYWGALYPRGKKRISAPQLFVQVRSDSLEFGFALGDHANEASRNLRDRLARDSSPAQQRVEDQLEGLGFAFGSHERLESGESFSSLDDWLTNSPADEAPEVRRLLRPEEVLAKSFDELAEEIAQAFEALYPLMLLTVAPEPWDAVAEYLQIDPERGDQQAHFGVEEIRDNTGFDAVTIDYWLRVIGRKKQIILQGPPGTGKTYVAQLLARYLVSETDGIHETVQFHSAYAYEDFMQGIRPMVRDGGALSYDLAPGRFVRFCKRAAKLSPSPCVLVIDEINRANLARVFGELMYLLEYRDSAIPLAAGGEPFRIPEHVYVIGTMNTADRSIARMDYALRRRFSFLRLRPEYDVLHAHLASFGLPAASLITALRAVNADIGDENFELGISYFMTPGERLGEVLRDIWECEVEPYLEEYFYDRPMAVTPHRWSTLCEETLAPWVRK